MAKLLKYSVMKRLGKYSTFQVVFNTSAANIEENEEWMTDELLTDLKDALPKTKNIGIDEIVSWYDNPDLYVLFHGWDKKQEQEQDNPEGLAYVAFYIDLKTNYGIIYLVETEGAY
jgi:hypothetical protein